MPEASQVITSMEPAFVHNDYRTVTITCMELELYNAAVDGETDVFKKKSDQIESMLTPNKNTILHVHLTRYEVLEAFVIEILDMCPALLMKANTKDETILHIAARYGHIGIVKIIIERVNKATSSEDGIKETLIKATNDKKDTALHEAIRYNHKEVVELLIKEDPDYPYFANSDGETPLYIAAERGYKKVMHTILEKSNSPNHRGPNGRTALHAASIHFEKLGGKKEILEELVSKIPSAIKEADENGWVPLHLAALNKNSELVEVLLRHDRNTAYMRDNKGRTALHFAAYCGNGLAMRKIIEYCPDCSELVDHKGRNALHYTTSLERGQLPFIGRLRAAEVFMDRQQLRNMHNEKDNDGNTPLHLLARYASTWKEYHFHHLLKENTKVDTMAFNKNNQTALDVAYDNVPSTSQFENLFLRKLQQKVRARFGERVINDDVKKMKIKKKICDSEVEKQKQEENDITKIYSKVRQTLLVVATLIATITFAAGFTLPGGTIQDGENNKGSPILMHNAAFKAFVITDSLSFVLSASAVFLQIFSSFVEGDKDTFIIDRGMFLAALLLTMLGMVFMIVAFGTGTYAILGSSIALAVVTLLIALSFFFTFVFLQYLMRKDETMPYFFPEYSFLTGEDMQLLDSV